MPASHPTADPSSPDASLSASDAGAAPSAPLVRALRMVLRPMVRLMLAKGVTYPYLVNLLKSIFVQVAEQEFRLDGKPPTDSRVSLITGVHRKDVSRLRQELRAAPEPRMPAVVSLGAQLTAQWLGSGKYTDEQGQPLPLHRFASEGGELSFEALVAQVNSDIRSRVVLDEWLRLGVARLDEQRRVCLNTEAFVPAEGFEEKAFYFGHNLHDHIAASASNLQGGHAPFFERSVHYDELSPASIGKLRKQVEQAGMRALLGINQSALKLEEQDKAPALLNPLSPSNVNNASNTVDQPKQRMTFGIYFYTEAAPPVVAAPTAPQERAP